MNKDSKQIDRREFVRTLATIGVVGATYGPVCCAGEVAERPNPVEPAIPKRMLGKAGVEVSALILGGVVAMKEAPTAKFDPAELANAAIDAGINYFDTAPGYGNGQSERNYGAVVATRRDDVFLATKTDKRSYDDVLRQVEESLNRLQTDHVDLLQIHGVQAKEDFTTWDKSDGILKALHALRDEKVTRFIGVTGHDSADAMCRAIKMDDFDTILTTFNPTEERRPFREQVIPLARGKKMGILAMKVIGGGNGALAIGNPIKNDGVPRHDDAPHQAEASVLIRYALGLPIAAAVVGMASLEQLHINVAGAKMQPLNKNEQQELQERMT